MAMPSLQQGICCPRKNSVETLCCQEFLQILWWNCNKICQDWLEIILVFIHTHWNPVLKHIHITSSKVILENCSHVFTPSRPLIVAIVSPQYYRRTAISTTSPILKHHEGGSSIGQGLGGILFNVESETHKVQLGCNQNHFDNKILNILKTYFITAFRLPRLLSQVARFQRNVAI